MLANPPARDRVPSHLQLPEVLFVGPQRAGTTWIYQYLLARGDVAVSRRVKEVFYFDRFYERGLAWYGAQFEAPAPAARIVDVAPSYFHSDAARLRIAGDLGQVRAVCTLRQPARRAYSLYLLYRRYGLTGGDFRRAVEELPQILESSRYATQVRRWKDVLGERAVEVMFLEDLARDVGGFARDLCRRLDIPYVEVEDALRKSPNPNDVLPASSALARVGLALGDAARRLRLYGAIDFGKRLGLRNLFFGGPGSRAAPRLTEAEFVWFMAQLGSEIEDLERMLQLDLSAWKTWPAPAASTPGAPEEMVLRESE